MAKMGKKEKNSVVSFSESTRDVFLELGGFYKNLSCPGEPGIGFDFEYSVRLWYNNFQVALMYSDFMRSHGAKAGTRANSKIWNKRRRTEIRNKLRFRF
ncbi:hypothetical protein HOP50_08g53840 [Chloropicon primus]|uniref:Uncharacterized protein n=1 Tax=Chloropicon primus TaxID=1764295 RepID=A0A5B8MT71_9CHLO|nr:hypothetical protein A3770_08p53530 [Chloropicon primus]UPR02060.1 hypothetical protein HOP50_08g53840 [Chloropicon primus]|eukprot:QDZ22835.1 hypothetical protein A3770_08p53530 [Chloropicon primus]